MPSFCKPFGFGPKVAMTRPRTGQRKVPAASPPFALSSASGAIGAASRALWGESTVATEPTEPSPRGAGGAAGVAGAAGGAAAADVEPTPGIVTRSPTFSIVSGGILLALAITMTDLW